MKLASAEKIARYRALGWWGDDTVHSLFDAAVARGNADEALVDAPNREILDGRAPRRLDWRALAQAEARTSAALAAQGLGEGDRLLIQAPNVAELVILLIACSRLGVIVSPLALQYEGAELRRAAEVIDARAFVGAGMLRHGSVLERARNALPSTIPVLDLLELEREQASPPDFPKVDADDCFSICWTSGTTGESKGVPRSHNHWTAQALTCIHALSIEPGDRLLCPFPFINMAAFAGCLIPWLKTVGTLVLHHPFDLPVFLEQVVDERIAVTLAPPAVLQMLLQQADAPGGLRPNFSGVKRMGSGSAPLAPSMVRGWSQRGLEIVNLFGSNEGSCLLGCPDTIPDPERRALYFPIRTDHSQIEVRLTDPESGAPVSGPGAVGEMAIRGPNVFEGYWGMGPDEAARHRLFDKDGFFRTGDIFEIDQEDPSLIRFVGRSKDIIIRGGFNISIAEVEALLADHPEVREIAAFPMPDPIMGEKVAVAVVPKDGCAPDCASLGAHLAGKQVARIKWPEAVMAIEAIPRNAMNKVLRRELVAQWRSRQQENANA